MTREMNKLQHEQGRKAEHLVTAMQSLPRGSHFLPTPSPVSDVADKVSVHRKETASSTAVLAIPELLLLILSHISSLQTDSPTHEIEDPRSTAVQSRANSLWTLLHAQRVNHTWRDLIRSTQALQQCLFVAPHTTSSASWTASRSIGSSRPVLNPLVQTMTHWRFSHLSPGEMGGKFSAHMIVERVDYEHLRNLPPTHKAMLLSHPPVTDVGIIVWERATAPEEGEARVRPPSSFYSIKRVRNDGGILFGELLEKVGQMMDEDSTLKAVKICTE